VEPRSGEVRRVSQDPTCPSRGGTDEGTTSRVDLTQVGRPFQGAQVSLSQGRGGDRVQGDSQAGGDKQGGRTSQQQMTSGTRIRLEFALRFTEENLRLGGQWETKGQS
jgi:hypothetical protein